VADEVLLLAGRYACGGMLQVSYLPHQTEATWRMTVKTTTGSFELRFVGGWPGPAHLTWQDELGISREEKWDAWNPWSALVEAFEHQVAASWPTPVNSWQEEIRCLELDDAARRSVERRRASTLEYQEATEEASFKGTMTLVGCALVWGSLLLLLLSIWVPMLGWMILPFFGVFLLLQLLRWIVPTKLTTPKAVTTAEQSSASDGPPRN
jgi:hypothetical protein